VNSGRWKGGEGEREREGGDEEQEQDDSIAARREGWKFKEEFVEEVVTMHVSVGWGVEGEGVEGVMRERVVVSVKISLLRREVVTGLSEAQLRKAFCLIARTVV